MEAGRYTHGRRRLALGTCTWNDRRWPTGLYARAFGRGAYIDFRTNWNDTLRRRDMAIETVEAADKREGITVNQLLAFTQRVQEMRELVAPPRVVAVDSPLTEDQARVISNRTGTRDLREVVLTASVTMRGRVTKLTAKTDTP